MGKREAKRTLLSICGKEGSKILLWAIKKKLPIMIYDRQGSGIDPLLYRALKRLGAPVVRNYDMTMERDGKVCGIYYTVFV